MEDTERDQLEEKLTQVLENALSCVKINISGRIIKKDDTTMIVETGSDQVKVDINDGITDAEIFKVGDTLTDLPIEGAYLSVGNAECREEVVFIFTSPD
ncbi:MAG: hypothetical protein U9P50_02460 [Patescibacteria group bacterium]|nr:hypothetical protein [Patescibacteria group bacterium]